MPTLTTRLKSPRDGAFEPLVVLVTQAGEGSRGVSGWTLELASLLSYSRPALALFSRVRADEVPVSVECRVCGAASELAAFPFACPACGSVEVDVISGEELLVESIEVADELAAAGKG